MVYAIEAFNITKAFPKVVANDDISIKIPKGTVHAIVGENGAGKSTLMNILYGLYTPTSGKIKIMDEEVELKNPKDAISKGVGMVHQHFMLIPTLTVAENIVLGNEPGSRAYYDRKKARKIVEDLCERYKLYVDPKAYVSDISVGMQQRVEILKALYQGADILILDEPTAVLTPLEIKDLFDNIRYLLSKGKTIIIITHKLDEVLDISDNISVLQRGKLVGNIKTEDANEEILTKMMVGRNVHLGGKERDNIENHKDILVLKNVNYEDSQGVKIIKDLSLKVKSGEIVGIAGVDGNGQTQLVEMISGVIKDYTGDIYLNQKNIKDLSIRDIREEGLGFIPEDRHRHGLIMDYTIEENMVCGIHYKSPFAKNRFIEFGKIEEFTNQKIKDFDIRTPSSKVKVGTLSGGNQQKVIIARELSQDPELIVATQPTRGLDIGAMEFVHDVLVKARNNDKAVLLVSLELDEVMALSDVIYVINNGEITGKLNKEEFDSEKIGYMMLGLQKKNIDEGGE